MSDLIERKKVENITWQEPHYHDPLNVLTEVREKVRALPTVDAIPVSWLTAQAENPSNSDSLRNAIDHIVYTMWAERKEE